MQFIRPAIATDPQRFGRGFPRVLAASPPSSGLSEDFKLFATTFIAGFLFVSMLLA
jgi:hypothetical protein